MNMLFRLIWTLIAYRFRSKVDIFGPARTPFRCWFTDLDVLMHMNNGKYFSLMDLGRVDLLARSGLMDIVNQSGWYPVVTAETARFYKSLKLFDRFEIETSVIGWDEKSVLLRQRFFRGETLMCDAVVRGRFLKKAGGSVPVSELLKAIDYKGEAPELEPWIEDWNQQQSQSKPQEVELRKT